jgi:hypothetical protein
LAGNLPIVYYFYFYVAKKSSDASNKKPVIFCILNIFGAGILLNPLSPACLALYGRLRIFTEMKLNILPIFL